MALGKNRNLYRCLKVLIVCNKEVLFCSVIKIYLSSGLSVPLTLCVIVSAIQLWESRIQQWFRMCYSVVEKTAYPRQAGKETFDMCSEAKEGLGQAEHSHAPCVVCVQLAIPLGQGDLVAFGCWLSSCWAGQSQAAIAAMSVLHVWPVTKGATAPVAVQAKQVLLAWRWNP